MASRAYRVSRERLWLASQASVYLRGMAIHTATGEASGVNSILRILGKSGVDTCHATGLWIIVVVVLYILIDMISGVASMEQMEQLLPPGRPGPLA